MKKLLLTIIALEFSLFCHCQIIADHTSVANFNNIPEEYIDIVKKMWVSYAGESHALGLLKGLELIELGNPYFSVSTRDYSIGGIPDPITNSELRASTALWGDFNNATGWYYEIGEEDWWTNITARNRVKASLSYCNNMGLGLSAIGFGWCWDALTNFEDNTPSSGTDPFYGVHWYGMSAEGPSGNKPWGIDNNDNAVSGNIINMDSYLVANQEYVDYCSANKIPTVVFFTTGPVDNWDEKINKEALYQGFLKNERIRDYVKRSSSLVLFDYADILCYNNNNILQTETWNNHIFPSLHPDNDRHHSTYTAHIGEIGAIRLAKAMWWMLARIAGWDGLSTEIDIHKAENTKPWTSINGKQLILHLPDTLTVSKIEFYSIGGVLISSRQAENINMTSFDITGICRGLYIIIIQNSIGTESVKVILP